MFWIKKRYVKNSNKRCLDYIKANYKLVDVINWWCPYNYRCHVNSVQYSKDHKQSSIFSCFQVSKNWDIIAHFINYNKWKFIETTQWRLWIKDYDYYIVKNLSVVEFESSLWVDEPLDNLKNYIFNIWYTNKFLNWIFKLNPYSQF